LARLDALDHQWRRIDFNTDGNKVLVAFMCHGCQYCSRNTVTL